MHAWVAEVIPVPTSVPKVDLELFSKFPLYVVKDRVVIPLCIGPLSINWSASFHQQLYYVLIQFSLRCCP